MRYKLASLFLLTFIYINAYGQSASNLNSSEIIKTEVMTDKDCKYVEFTRMDILPSRKEMSVSWSGDCRDGYLSGLGTLKIALKDGAVQITKVNFTNGMEDGEGEATKTGNTYNESFVGRWQKGLRTYGTQEIKYGDKSFAKYTGEFKDAKYHGFGKFFNSGGTEYEGDFKNGEFSGKGKMKDPSGSYEGEFKDGKKHGQGEYIFKNGGYLKGEFLEGFCITCTGKLIGASDTFSEGEFSKFVLNGKGIKKYSNNTIDEGLFENGIFKKGIRKFSDGSIYEGEISDGKMNGRGTFKSVSGDIYVGSFENNLRHGKGKINSDSKGAYYEGDFFEGKIQGKGIQRFTSGQIQEGEFANGKIIKGKVTFPNGEVQEGTFLDNKMHGIVKITMPNGDSDEGNYENGYKNGEFSVIRGKQKSTVSYRYGKVVSGAGNPTTLGGASNTDLKVSGVDSKDNSLLNFDDAKKKCTDIGFKAGTEKFGQCVLKLTK